MLSESESEIKEKDAILVICAHSDDQILGCGGTMAKFAKKGIPVYTIIMSYGEKSHPHIQEEFIIKKRVKEAQVANDIIQGKKVFFLGLKEGKFETCAKETNAEEKLLNLFDILKVKTIFTHSSFDAHPDHIFTHKLVKSLVKNKDTLLYTFTVWNMLKGMNKLNDSPKLVIDITDTWKTKINALHAFQSQKMQMSLPYVQTYINAFFNGLNYGYRFAEVFIKEQ